MLNLKQLTLNKIIFIVLIIIAIILLPACNELTVSLNTNTPSEENMSNLKQGVVTYVIDGDTFDVELENGETERIRPILVNAPEICHASSPTDCEVEPYGNEATDFTKELLEGETVYLEQDISVRDPYDRLLVYVYLEDGSMYQELILEEGLAEVAVYEPDVKYQSQLESIEQEAKDQQLNLWSE